jgi:hypothetical protein
MSWDHEKEDEEGGYQLALSVAAIALGVAILFSFAVFGRPERPVLAHNVFPERQGAPPQSPALPATIHDVPFTVRRD